MVLKGFPLHTYLPFGYPGKRFVELLSTRADVGGVGGSDLCFLLWAFDRGTCTLWIVDFVDVEAEGSRLNARFAYPGKLSRDNEHDPGYDIGERFCIFFDVLVIRIAGVTVYLARRDLRLILSAQGDKYVIHPLLSQKKKPKYANRLKQTPALTKTLAQKPYCRPTAVGLFKSFLQKAGGGSCSRDQ